MPTREFLCLPLQHSFTVCTEVGINIHLGRSWKSGEAGSIFVHADELEYDGGISTGKLSGYAKTVTAARCLFEDTHYQYCEQ